MSFKVRPVPDNPQVEEYETTFTDWQNTWDRARWIGCGFTGEYPHNPGSLEEKVDEAQERKIVRGK